MVLAALSSSPNGRVSLIQVRHTKRMGAEGLAFYHPSLLCCPDQMLAVVELSQHLVSSSKTVRPIISRDSRCVEHVKIMWSAVCSSAPHSHFAEEARPHLCTYKLKHPAPVRWRLSLTQTVLVKLIPISLALTLGMQTQSADVFLEYSVSHPKFVHWAARKLSSDKLCKIPRGRSKRVSRFQSLLASSLRLRQLSMQNVARVQRVAIS